MNEFLDFLFWVAFFVIAIKVLDALLALRRASLEADMMRENMSERLEVILHNVKEEVHNDVHYWFDDDNDEFLAQGSSISDVKKHIQARFKDHIFIVREKYVMIGPEYEIKEVGDEEAIGKYIAKVMMERVGFKLDK